MYRPREMFLQAWEKLLHRAVQGEEARNQFLVDLQPFVQYCVDSALGRRGVPLHADDREDVLSEINLYLVEKWYKRLDRKSSATRAQHYLATTIDGQVYNWVTAFLTRIQCVRPSMSTDFTAYFERDVDFKLDRSQMRETFCRQVARYVVFRPKCDREIVERMWRCVLWERYRWGEDLLRSRRDVPDRASDNVPVGCAGG